MSQPPPPPGNPPNVGKPGGPVPPPPLPPQGPAPAQPQYGYPQTPAPPASPAAQQPTMAAGPGYGYPQGPGQAPGPQMPPGAAPGNPYAQPVPPGQNPYAQQPPQQPQYGYPQQGGPQQGGYPPPGYQGAPFQGAPYPGAPYQGAPIPGGTGGRSSGKPAAIIAAMVAVVLMIGGGVWFATKGGDGKPVANGGTGGTGGNQDAHDSQGQLLWKQMPGALADPNLVRVPQVWFTDTDVVKTTPNAVTAWNLKTGQQHWSTPITNRSCLASTNTVDNKIVVSTGTNCNEIEALDLSNGKRLWTQKLKSGSSSTYEFDGLQIALAGDTVAVAWTSHSATYKLSTGAPSWGSAPGAKCDDAGYAGGKRLLVVLNCGYNDGAAIQEVDPATGSGKWTWQAPAGAEIRTVISVDPVVVGIKVGEGMLTDLVVLDNGKAQTRISLGVSSDSAKYDVDCPANEVQPCYRAVVSQDAVFLTSGTRWGAHSDFHSASDVVALDLKTGKVKWTSHGGTARETVAMAFENGRLFAYQPASFRKPGVVVTIDAATGQISPYLNLPAASIEVERNAYGLTDSGLAWYKDHLVLFNQTIYHGNSEESIAAWG